MQSKTLRVAALQAAPVWMNREATLALVVEKIREAGAAGARLVAFPETFVPGYPAWVDITNTSAWEDADQQAAYAWYLDQAVDVDGEEFGEVVSACREAGVFAYVGIAELSRSRGSIYCSLVAIDPEQGVAGVHRKLKPTFGERLVWADGDGNGLLAHQHDGVRVSGLNCWENWMPLTRAAMYAQGPDVHVASWPGASRLTRDISRFIAIEGRVFVVSVGGLCRAADIPKGFPLEAALRKQGEVYYNGGTTIVAPGGDVLVAPVEDDEKLIYAELDMELVRRARQNFDAAGHYSRPDVLRLEVERRRS